MRVSKKQRDEERRVRQNAALFQRTGIDSQDVPTNARGHRKWTLQQQRLLVELARQASTIREFGEAIGVNSTQLSSWTSMLRRKDLELEAGQKAAEGAREGSAPPLAPLALAPPALPPAAMAAVESPADNGNGSTNGLPTRPKIGRPPGRPSRLAEFDDEDDFVGLRAKSVDDAIRYLSKLRNVAGRVQVKIYLPS